LAIKSKNRSRKAWSGTEFTYRKSKGAKILPVLLEIVILENKLPLVSGRINIIIDFFDLWNTN